MKIIFLSILLLSSLFATQKVVVIGGGLSGLTCAYRLSNQGVDVHLYEARNRLGGRVFTVISDGCPVELGGQNIRDGGDAKHFTALARSLGLELEEAQSELTLKYLLDGNLISFQEALKQRKFEKSALKKELKAIQAKSKNMEEVLSFLFAKEDPLYIICKSLLTAYEGGDPQDLSVIYTETLYHMLTGGLSATHEENNGVFEHLFVKGGNGLIGEKIKEKMHSRIHLNSILQSIRKNQDGKFLLAFVGGKEVVSDILVLTMPCGAYKNIDISADVIDSMTLQSIRNVKYGTNTKMVVPIVSLERPRSFSNGRFITFSNHCFNALNVFFLQAKNMDPLFPMRGVTSFLERFYTLKTNAPAVYAQDASFSSYQNPVVHNWEMDPFAKGSYSFVAAGQEEIFTAVKEVHGIEVKTLFAPIDDRLFFAGEHTAVDQDILGTMEAAVESGERAANLVQKSLTRTFALSP